MSGKNSAQNVINSYQRRQKLMPYIVWGLAGLLVLVGVVILVIWMTGSNGPLHSLFATSTPTPTATYTPSPIPPTATASLTPTITLTSTPAATNTPSGPFEIEVQSGDTCYDLAAKYKADLPTMLKLNNFPAGQCPIKPGDKILIPPPGLLLPTRTPLPTNLPRGTRITYTVESGDSLDLIAQKFDSTVEAIIAANPTKLKSKTEILYVGVELIIPVNLVTPTPTRAPTSTPNATQQAAGKLTPASPTVTPTK